MKAQWCLPLVLVAFCLLLARSAAEEKKSEARQQALLKVKGTLLSDGGLEISEIDPDGPAANLRWADGTAGRVILEKGDVIIAVEGKKFRSMREMLDLLNAGYAANKGRVYLRIRNAKNPREFGTFVARPVLERREVPAGPADSSEKPRLPGAREAVRRLQAMLRTRGEYLPDGKGYRITYVASDGPAANLAPDDGESVRGVLDVGDVILAIDGKPFHDRREFLDLMNEAFERKGGKVPLRVQDVNTGKIKVWIARPIRETIDVPAGSGSRPAAKPVDPIEELLGKPARSASEVPAVTLKP
jgi:S1-C subfamily serine protease